MKKSSTILRTLPVLAALFFVAGSSTFAQTVIGGNTPDASAMLDVQSNSKGVLFPRMTSTQKGNITTPATGLIIFNTTTKCLEINLGTSANPSWQEIICAPIVATLDCQTATVSGVSTNPLMPTVAASGVSVTLPYTGGNGKAYEGQSFSSTGITGLTATLAAGSLAVGAGNLTLSINGSGPTPGLAEFALNIGGQTCNLKIPVGCGAYVANDTWQVFDCYNLNSNNTAANPFAPSWEINGGYWQWGRIAEAAPGPSGTGGSTPNEGAPSVWNTGNAANDAWKDAEKTSEDPCPPNFRIPTKAQWDEIIANVIQNPRTVIGSTWTGGNLNYSNGIKLGNNLFLPAAGARNRLTGVLGDRGAWGRYWSSTWDSPYSGYAWNLWFNNISAPYTNSNFFHSGLSVRCVAE
jgi:uncharacterized protein (TIGR02145 family)